MALILSITLFCFLIVHGTVQSENNKLRNVNNALRAALESLTDAESQVGSSSDKCWTGLIFWQDYCWGTIDYVTDPYWKKEKGADGSGRYKSLDNLGEGCRVAPNAWDLVSEVVARHPFGTPVVIMSNGFGYGTSMAKNIPGWGPGQTIPNSQYLLHNAKGYATGISHSKVFIRCDAFKSKEELYNEQMAEDIKKFRKYNPGMKYDVDYSKSLAWPLQNNGALPSIFPETWWGLSNTGMLWQKEFYGYNYIVDDCMKACNDDCGYAVNLSLGMGKFKDYDGKMTQADTGNARNRYTDALTYSKTKAKAWCRCYSKAQTEDIFGVSAETTHDSNRKPKKLNGSKDWVLYTMNPYEDNKWCGTGVDRKH